MLRKIAEKIWWLMPHYFRWRLVWFTQNKFTVSVVGIITNEKQEILILDHYFRLRYSWGLPGGFINRGEIPKEAIKREIKEETDLDLKDINLIKVRNVGRHIEIMFRASATGNGKVTSREIREIGWFKIDNLPEMSDVQIKLLKNALNK